MKKLKRRVAPKRQYTKKEVQLFTAYMSVVHNLLQKQQKDSEYVDVEMAPGETEPPAFSTPAEGDYDDIGWVDTAVDEEEIASRGRRKAVLS